LHAKARQQPGGDSAIGAGAVDQHGPAIHQQGPVVDAVLVTACMAAAVVVVVEDQDARAWLRIASEHRRRKAADAGADDGQVVRAVARLGCGGRFSLGQCMRRREAAGLATAQALEQRRVGCLGRRGATARPDQRRRALQPIPPQDRRSMPRRQSPFTPASRAVAPPTRSAPR
jgi:hypothetical protein